MITIERISSTDGFRDLESAWGQLLQAGGYHTIFQTHAWLFTWWECLAGDSELYLLAVKHDDHLIGIAPLMLTPAQEIRFIGTPNADYCDIIGPDKKLLWSEILRYLTEHRSEWTTAIIDQLTERSTSHEELRAVLREHAPVFRESVCDVCLAFQYEGPPEIRARFELRKSGNVKKATRYFEQLGQLRLSRLDESEALRALPNLFHLHISRWSQSATPSKFADDRHRRFYTELVKRLAPRGQLYFTETAAGGVPVAYCVLFEYQGTINHYTLAHNAYFAKWSPGATAVVWQSEKLVREGFFLDFSRGAQDYKQVMTNRTFNNYRFDIFQSAAQAQTHDLRRRIRNIGLVRALLDNRRVSEFRGRLSRLARSGNGHLLAKLARRALRVFYDHQTILAFAHAGAPADVPAPPIPVEVRELTAEHLPLVATFYCAPQNGQKYQTLERRFQQQADCFGVFHDGNLVTVSWGLPFTDMDPMTGFALVPGENEVVLSDGLTSLPYRGMRLRSYLLHYQLSKYCRQNKRVLLATAQDNASMLGVIRKFNFTSEPAAHIIKVLGIRIR